MTRDIHSQGPFSDKTKKVIAEKTDGRHKSLRRWIQKLRELDGGRSNAEFVAGKKFSLILLDPTVKESLTQTISPGTIYFIDMPQGLSS